MRIRTLLSGLGFGAFFLIAGTAFAARTGVSLSIQDITVIGTQARIFIGSGLSGTAPTCGSAHPSHFGIDLTTDKGRAQLSLATAAMLSGKTINVTGATTSTDCITSDFAAQNLYQLTLNP
jgi:hypothetical protein